MKLRKLCGADAPLMLEWMHDPSVAGNMGTNFAEKTVEDCQRFVTASQENGEDLHLAVADENDAYMGTVSLKHLNRDKGTAEFAITVRKCAMGKGYSAFGMNAILKLGLKELGLKQIYWCVSPKNARAVRFYDKNSYPRVQEVPEHIAQRYSADMELIWYCVRGE